MQLKNRIYFDNNATTALDPRVFKAMLKDLSGPPANPSSIHWFGQQAKNYLLRARETLSHFFKAKPEEILFTSGGTESLNLVLRGLKGKGPILSTAIEHSSCYRTLQSLGHDIHYVPVGPWGAPLLEEIIAAVKPDTQAIVLSASNAETGVKLDLAPIADFAYQKGIPLILDAIAYIGKEDLPLHKGIAAIALSGHKFHGPKGIGALYLRSDLKLTPTVTGGAQEYHKRAGTENLSGILGLAESITILQESQTQITQTLLDLRNHFEQSLLHAIPDLQINGAGPRIANTSNIAFLGLDGETLLMQLDLAGIAASHGSACSAGALEPSRVLTQMGLDRKTARSSLRFSFSRQNTREEIDQAVEILIQLTRHLRNINRRI